MVRPAPALVAALIGVATVPAFVLTVVPGTGELAIAALAVALATLASIAVVRLSVPAGPLGAALLGPALGIVAVARVCTDRAIAAAEASPGVVGSVVLALVFACLAWGFARLGEPVQRMPAARRIVAALAATMLALGVAIAASAALRGEAPTSARRLESLRATHRFGVLLDDDQAQRETSLPPLVIERTCHEAFCELVASTAHEGERHIGSRRPLADQIDRAPLAIVALRDVVVVLPERAGALDWSEAIAFDRETARSVDVHAADLGVAIGPPDPWRVVAIAGVVLALVLLAFRVRARRVLRTLAHASDATVDEDGVLRLGDGTVARAERPVVPGRHLVLALDRGVPSYREDGLPIARGIAPGTVASHRALVEQRSGAIDLAAIGALAITHAPLVAAWFAGYAVLGR